MVAIVLAGCGGDDGDDSTANATTSTTSTTAAVPEAEQPIADQIPIFEHALDSLDCDDALEVVHPVLFADPEHPTSPANCDAALDPLRAERGVEILDSEELGTGAVVDTKFRGNDETVIFALDDSGRFKYTANYITRDAQVGTEPDPEVDFQGVADAFVDALRAGDCHAAHGLLADVSRLGYASEQQFCNRFEKTYTSTPEGLGSRLQDDPTAKPALLDATRDIAIFGLATEPAGYRTLILVTPGTGADPVVLDLLPTER